MFYHHHPTPTPTPLARRRDPVVIGLASVIFVGSTVNLVLTKQGWELPLASFLELVKALRK